MPLTYFLEEESTHPLTSHPPSSLSWNWAEEDSDIDKASAIATGRKYPSLLIANDVQPQTQKHCVLLPTYTHTLSTVLQSIKNKLPKKVKQVIFLFFRLFVNKGKDHRTMHQERWGKLKAELVYLNTLFWQAGLNCMQHGGGKPEHFVKCQKK